MLRNLHAGPDEISARILKGTIIVSRPTKTFDAPNDLNRLFSGALRTG